MGGGGGGIPFDNDDLKTLGDLAKKTIKDRLAPRKKNIFISFVNEDKDEVNLLRGQAKNQNSELEFNDYSLKKPFNSKDAEYIKRGIRERIKQSSITVVYISEFTANSKWVDWEIRESVRLGKSIIALHTGDHPPKKLPSALNEFGIKPVKWDHKEITKALDKVR